ncbi:transposase [Amycolatopsis sp. MtRt-6]|uniref:transposase n=1 Tax=Amycolatopsis sp. MtRt-6 TaxID=2792782 RepID=UPI001A8D5044
MRSLAFDRVGVRLAFEEAYDAVLVTQARRARLDTAITELAATPVFAPVVGRLSCLRGVSTLTAFGLATEIGDWHRFTGASIGAYVGLVPAESSSGEHRHQGAITKTGNSHARRLLVEAAWHHRKRCRLSREVVRRQDGQPAAVRARAEAGNRRLHRRWTRLDTRSKRSTISAVAVARELAGRHAQAARGATRYSDHAGGGATLDPGDAEHARRTPGHAVTNPRISALTARRPTTPHTHRSLPPAPH